MTTRRDFIAGVSAVSAVAASGLPVIAAVNPAQQNPFEAYETASLGELIWQRDMLRWFAHTALHGNVHWLSLHDPDHPRFAYHHHKANVAMDFVKRVEVLWQNDGIPSLRELERRDEPAPRMTAYTMDDGWDYRAYLAQFERQRALGRWPWLYRRLTEDDATRARNLASLRKSRNSIEEVQNRIAARMQLIRSRRRKQEPTSAQDDDA